MLPNMLFVDLYVEKGKEYKRKLPYILMEAQKIRPGTSQGLPGFIAGRENFLFIVQQVPLLTVNSPVIGRV